MSSIGGPSIVPSLEYEPCPCNRSGLIGQIGSHLNLPVLAYVTGDRAGLQTQISAEQIPLFPRHLTSIGHHDRVALLLYTRGGDTNVPWSVITVLREHCSELLVLIPYAAHSSGTLLALGADEIVMTRFATISPIDPTVANAFNPIDPANPGARYPIAVEDVLAFLELAKENVDGASYERTFEALAQIGTSACTRQRQAKHQPDQAARQEAHRTSPSRAHRRGTGSDGHAADD